MRRRRVEEIFSSDAAFSAVKLTPSHIALLAALPSRAAHIATAIVGGEALTPAHVRTLKEHCPGVRVFNEYGPTETTVGAVGGYVSAEDIHIGTPYANTRVYVLDAESCALPGGRARGALHCRRGAGARLLAPAGADRRDASSPTLSHSSRESGSTALAISPAGATTATCYFTAAPTSR